MKASEPFASLMLNCSSEIHFMNNIFELVSEDLVFPLLPRTFLKLNIFKSHRKILKENLI